MSAAEIGALVLGGLGALAAGVGIGGYLKGRPPAPREEWEKIADKRRAELAAKNREHRS